MQAFPEEEESVRVPLREKYNTLMQRLRQCNILGINIVIIALCLALIVRISVDCVSICPVFILIYIILSVLQRREKKTS